MSLIDNISKKVGEAVSAAAKMSGDFVEVTKIKMEIRNKEDQIQKLYAEIGKIIYKKYEEKSTLEDQLVKLCEEITILDNEATVIKSKLLSAKDTQVCKSCNTEISSSLEFCSNCGIKMTEKTSQNIVPDVQFCKNCGIKLEDGTNFCGSCGKKVE